MKRKLRIDELAVASFTIEDDELSRERGTVRAASGDTQEYASCVSPETCAYPCGEVRTRDTCYNTACGITCGRSCSPTCVPALCI